MIICFSRSFNSYFSDKWTIFIKTPPENYYVIEKRKEQEIWLKMYDPWSKITTRNGYAGDEVISALQKSIRRGLEEQACMFAYEMYISSPQLEGKSYGGDY